MAVRAETGDLRDSFSGVQFERQDAFDLTDYTAARIHFQDTIETANLRGIQMRMGMGDAHELSGGLGGGVLIAQAILQRHEAEEAEKKARTDDALFLALLDQLEAVRDEIDQIDRDIEHAKGEIAALSELIDQMESGAVSVEDMLADTRVQNAIEQWERRNNTQFDPEEENADGVLALILREEKDRWENDLAGLEQRRGRLVVLERSLSGQVNALVAENPQLETHRARIDELTASREGGFAVAVETRLDDDIRDHAWDERDDFRDGSFLTEDGAEANLLSDDAGFSGFAAFSLPQNEGDKITQASANGRQEFNASAADADVASSEQIHDLNPDLQARLQPPVG